MITHTIGAVIAGGSSTRMGMPKSELTINDERFIDIAVDRLTEVFEDVVVCGPSRVGDHQRLSDAVIGAGPMGGISAALDHADPRAVFALAVDTPLITTEVIMRVLGSDDPPTGIRVARTDERLHPLCAVYGADMAVPMRRQLETSDRSLTSFVMSSRRATPVGVEAKPLTNVNTPEDLTLIRNKTTS